MNIADSEAFFERAKTSHTSHSRDYGMNEHNDRTSAQFFRDLPSFSYHRADNEFRHDRDA